MYIKDKMKMLAVIEVEILFCWLFVSDSSKLSDTCQAKKIATKSPKQMLKKVPMLKLLKTKMLLKKRSIFKMGNRGGSNPRPSESSLHCVGTQTN